MKRSRRTSHKPSRKTAVVVVIAILLIAGAGAGVALKSKHDRDQDKATAKRDAARELVAEKAEDAAAKEAADRRAARREIARQTQRLNDLAEKTRREAAIKQLEKSITKDGQDRVENGELDGPILYSSCDPLGGGSVDDLTALTTTFDCIAVNEKLGAGRVRGYGFSATMNWDKGSYTWQLTG